MKKTLILSALALLALAPHALAEGFTALAPIPGLTDTSATSVLNAGTLAAFFNNLYKYLIGVAATIAVIEIIWGGIEYSTTDSVGNKEEGKKRIQEAIFGLILVLSPVLVFSIINPSILNLSLNLPPINLTAPQDSTTTTTLPTCVSGQTTNCTPPVVKNEGQTINTLPTCGADVPGTCTNAQPACNSGKYCFYTTDSNHIAASVCSTTQQDCQTLYTQQSNGSNGGVSATSGCSLCP
jgi:hypothetical protein